MKKIIIVEDDDDLLDTLRDMLESEGHTIKGFSDIDGVIPAIQKWHPDVAFVDIRLPGGRGDDLVSAIKSSPNTNGVKIYLMSASDVLSKLADDSHADGYLTKPFGFQEVIDLVN